MKKIIGVIFLAFFFALAINLTYAENVTDQDYLTALEDLDNYSKTTFSLKIRYTHFLNTLDYKIDQINYTITKLEENNIDTNQIYEKLSDLNVIKSEVNSVLLDKNLTEDDLILKYVSLKQDALNIISETRLIFKEIIPEDLHNEIRSLYKDQRVEIRANHRENIKQLVQNHNQEMRLKVQNNFNNFKKQFCDQEGCFKNKNEFRNDFENNFQGNNIKQNLEHRDMVLEKKELLKKMNQNRKEVMQSRSNNLNIGGNR